MPTTPKYIQNPSGLLYPFFRGSSPLSNWYMCNIEVRGRRFNCVEQHMMYSKARMFGDLDAARRIMASDDPAVHKAEGRKVKGFDKLAWDFAAVPIVREAVLAKFSQNKVPFDTLMDSQGATFVEVNRWDKIWGCGLPENSLLLHTQSPEDWPGKNQLGRMLTSMRDTFAVILSY